MNASFAKTDVRLLANYVGGKWIAPDGVELLDVENPSTGEVLARVPLSTAADVGRAVECAAAAYPAWSATPVTRRVEPLLALAGVLRSQEETLARSIAQEMGKSLPDARAEVKRLVENCEVACGMSVLQQGEKLLGSANEIDGEVLRVPLGVFGMIPPFNFPGMVPFWFLPYALATGNTFVLKPSEQVPLTMQLIASWFDEVGLPPGVFNLVNGDKAAAEAILDHPKIQGVSVVGSTRTCQAVARRCAETGKRFQAFGSAKNHLVVMPDAKLDEVVRNLVTSCYGCAGQRCMASSVIVGVGAATCREVARRFIDASRCVPIANPLDPAVADQPMVMGPVISARAKQSIEEWIARGVDEGATLALDGRNCVVPGCAGGHFIGPTVLTGVRPGSAVHRTEIFGPVVAMIEAATLDEAIRIINDNPYGNGASIYTQNGYWARRFKLEVQCGMIGVNIGIPAPVAALPFGGMKASFFGDIKGQGKAVIHFFTQEKVITERYWPEAD